MKVKDLVKLLDGFDPEAIVYYFDRSSYYLDKTIDLRLSPVTILYGDIDIYRT